MSDIITLTGLVATTPRVITTEDGLAVTSFRLASSQRRFDKTENKWVDGETNWYTITTFRQLATNTAPSIKKGERVLVTGRLRVRDWVSGDRAGTNVDVEADALGHDLSWGTAAFSRTISSPPSDTAASAAAAEADDAATSEADESADLVAASATVTTPF